MKIVEGRKDSIIVLPDGRSMSSFAFIAGMYQLSFYSSIEQFRIIQKKENVFQFLIKMKARRVDQKAAKQELIRYFCHAFNIREHEVDFAVDFVDDIPLDKSGKFKIVVSELSRVNTLST
jgi:hypothetical protein